MPYPSYEAPWRYTVYDHYTTSSYFDTYFDEETYSDGDKYLDPFDLEDQWDEEWLEGARGEKLGCSHSTTRNQGPKSGSNVRNAATTLCTNAKRVKRGPSTFKDTSNSKLLSSSPTSNNTYREKRTGRSEKDHRRKRLRIVQSLIHEWRGLGSTEKEQTDKVLEPTSLRFNNRYEEA